MAKRVLIYTNHFFPEQFKINEIVDWLLEENHHVRVVTGLPNYPKGKIFKDYDNLTKNRYKKEDRLIINRLLLIPRGNGSYFMLAINYLSYFISSILFTFYLRSIINILIVYRIFYYIKIGEMSFLIH